MLLARWLCRKENIKPNPYRRRWPGVNVYTHIPVRTYVYIHEYLRSKLCQWCNNAFIARLVINGFCVRVVKQRVTPVGRENLLLLDLIGKQNSLSPHTCSDLHYQIYVFLIKPSIFNHEIESTLHTLRATICPLSLSLSVNDSLLRALSHDAANARTPSSQLPGMNALRWSIVFEPVYKTLLKWPY